MRVRRFRFRIRTLLLLVALVALALTGQRLYRDGPETHWLLLKLRYGNVEARRSAAIQAGKSGPEGADRFIPALAQAANDPDAGCRARALRALHNLVVLYAPESEKTLVLRQILAATRDPDDSVRAAAVGSLVGLADRDTRGVITAIQWALADSSVVVRQTAARALGMIAATLPATQPDAASILIPLLASREDSRVRVQAAWGLCYFGRDHRRHRAGEFPADVVPALVTALRDPDVEVRRTAAVILGLTTYDPGERRISSWDRRKASIIPALKAGISDLDKAVREESALALYAFGQRDAVVIELIEQAARDRDRVYKSNFETALKEWQAVRKAKKPAEPGVPGDATL